MDNFVVSALKYRPATFRSVIGQPSLTNTLKNAIQSKKLAHSYLFCGPRGVGKTTCARIFAKTINCFSPTADGEACNECESCVSFNEQRSYNIYELDAASNNGVEHIRSLVEQVRIPPQLGSYKVYIIDEVHMLSQSAFNAFLKTLEEPPAYALFIMATTEKHKVLPTILSRCQIYDFNRITINDTIAHLAYVAGQEQVRVEEAALTIIAQKADGAMRDALSIFDQLVSFTGGNLTYQAAIDNLNVLNHEYFFRLLAHFIKGEVAPSLLIFDDIIRKGFDGQHFISGLASFFRDVLVSRDPATLPLLEAGEAIANRFHEAAKNCSIPFLYKGLELCGECDMNYRLSKNKRLSVEITLIKLCQILHPVQQELPSSAQPLRAVGQPAAAAPQPAHTAPPQPSTAAPQPTPTPSMPAVPMGSATPHEVAPEPLPKQKKAPVLPWKTAATQAPNSPSEEVAEKKKNERQPITLEGMEKAWKKLINSIPEHQQLLFQAVRTSIIQMTDAEVVEVAVVNPSQEYEINQASISLLNTLREELHNYALTMQVVVQTTEGPKRAFSKSEQFEEMRQEIPLVEAMKRDFGLML